MEEIDLTNSKWSLDAAIYLVSVVEGIKDNYPEIDLKKELADMKYSEEDLLDPEKVSLLMEKLNKMYPD